MIILGFNFDEGKIGTIGYIGLTACLLGKYVHSKDSLEYVSLASGLQFFG